MEKFNYSEVKAKQLIDSAKERWDALKAALAKHDKLVEESKKYFWFSGQADEHKRLIVNSKDEIIELVRRNLS